MEIRFNPAASRHGISHARSRFVVEHCTCPLYPADADDEDLIVFLGPDGHGVALEVMGLEMADGAILVFHARKLRRRYLDDYMRVMECQAR